MTVTTGPLGLRARATLAWGVIALFLSSALAGFAYQVTRSQLVAERQNNALNQAYLNARYVRNSLTAGDRKVAEALSEVRGGVESAALIRVGGEWFSESVAVGPSAIPSSLASEVASGKAARQLTVLDGRPFVAIGVAIPSVDGRYFEMVAIDDVERTLGGLAGRLAAIAGVATLCGAAVGWFASGRILKPLRQFTSAAERLAEGGLDTRIVATGDRDLRTLARSFNRMADAVQQRIDREARFTSQVSHELRSPVAALFSVINVARRRRNSRESVYVLDDMEERVRNLHGLVEDLLELSRVDAGVTGLQLEAVEPVELLRSVLKKSGADSIDLEMGEGVPALVMVDRRRVTQIVQNLIDNADNYAGGVCAVGLEGNDGRWRIVVDDKGPGIAPEEQSLVFERFARGEAALKSENSGAGLGLALASEHASLHGGEVKYSQSPQGGARFVVEFPTGIELQ